MRLGYLLVGLALGAGFVMLRSGRLSLQGLMPAESTGGEHPMPQPRSARAGSQATAERKPARATTEQHAEGVEELVDEVVHHQDVPETPVKRAFEAALEHQHPHGP